MTAELPETCTFAEFARIGRFKSRSYVTQLRDAGRIVMTEDGKRVRVRESLALLEQTRSPAHQGVTDRHAAARADTVPAAEPAEPVRSPEGDDEELKLPPGPHSERRAKALADKAEVDAEVAKRDLQISLGKLIPVEEVEQLAAQTVTTFRQSLERLPSILSPELSTLSDEGRVRVVLAESIEHALGELERSFATMGRRESV